jgi:serine/threonine protein kinase
VIRGAADNSHRPGLLYAPALQTHGGRTQAQQRTACLQSLAQQRYRIISQIGKGGFGAVYKAADLQFGNRQVAIKEMSQSNLSTQELVEATEAFKREALLLAGMTHPTCRHHEQFTDIGRWYLVMNIEGETLKSISANWETNCQRESAKIGISLRGAEYPTCASPHHLPRP